VGQLIVLVERYPSLVDAAFVIIAWIGFKLCVDYLHSAGYVSLEIPQWLSLALIVVIFAVALIYARIQGPAEPDNEVDSLKEKAEEMLMEESAIKTKET
jgi:predicted tellurium resistance membrane protein TerC